MARPKKYATEEECKEARRASYRKYNQKRKAERAKWYQEHKQEVAEKAAIYRQERKNEIAEHKAKLYNTKEGRAYCLITNYKRKDKKYGRGDCDLTVPWFVRNIYTKCIYCGETDWKKLGADRIDNSLPHTIVNVVPCCLDCNNKRQKKPFEQFYMESKMQKSLENICLTK